MTRPKRYSDDERIASTLALGDEMAKALRDLSVTEEALDTDTRLQWLVSTPLMQIGEHCTKISSEVTVLMPEVEWDRAAGMRHILVHDYLGTEWSIIYTTITSDIPRLISDIKGYLRKPSPALAAALPLASMYVNAER